MNIDICKLKINKEWDEFVESVPNSSFEQTSFWQSVEGHNCYGSDCIRLMVCADGVILGGCQIVIRKYPFVGNFGVVNQGPVIKEQNNDVGAKIILELKKLVKTLNLLYITVDVRYNHDFLVPTLKLNHFVDTPDFMPPYLPFKGTLLVNLMPETDDILSSFHPSRRKNIKRGLKLGFTTTDACRNGIPIFFELMQQACLRRNTKPLVNDIQYFYCLWDTLSLQNKVFLQFAEVDNIPVCAQFSVAFNNTFYAMVWGWNGTCCCNKITESFMWQNMLFAKDKGFKYYDCGQIVPEIAQRILLNKPLENKLRSNKMYGVTEFKLKWGGQAIVYPGAYSIFKNRFYSILYISILRLLYASCLVLFLRKSLFYLKGNSK
jgi:lipid II:glycine glycyltransferase (peptidoglycan interpeptide bridge formation enzyme)